MEDEMEIFPEGDLDEFAEILQEAEMNGQHVYANFNGHILHSKDIKTVDDAYMIATGHTKEGYDQFVQESIKRDKRKRLQAEREALEKVPERIIRGEKIIFPERHEGWRKYVLASIDGLYQGDSIDEVIEIMEALENGASIDEAKGILYRKDYSGIAEQGIRDKVLEFSSRGPDFWEATYPYGIERVPGHIKEYLDEKREENRTLADYHDITDGPGRHI